MSEKDREIEIERERVGEKKIERGERARGVGVCVCV